MNTLRNTEESRQNQSNIDLAAEKSKNIADRRLLEMLSSVKHYFDCHQLCAITHLNDLLSDHVFDWQKELPSHPDDLKYLFSDLTEIINHVMATVTLISELYTHLDDIDTFRKNAAIDESSIFFDPKIAQAK